MTSQTSYWNQRYSHGGTSGKGSRGEYAQIKADFVTKALDTYGITQILDLGCGDGVVANLIIADDYLGVDPSPYAVALARVQAPQHTFSVNPPDPREAHLSMDVIRHLVNDENYRRYMSALFSATKAVFVWSSDVNKHWSWHERERRWTPDVPDGWTLAEKSLAFAGSRFYVYLKDEP